MKKLITLLLATSLLLTACGTTSDDNSDSNSSNETGEWKKIALTMDVDLISDGSIPSSTCLGGGAFALDLYFPFPEDEGDIVELAAEESFFQLTNYHCTNRLSDCSVTLPESSYEPFEITADATMERTSSSWAIAGIDIDTPGMDQLTLHPTFQCEGAPGQETDPALLMQIFSIFTKGYEKSIDGFAIPFGDGAPEIFSINVPLYLDNSVDVVITGTASNVNKLP